MVAGDCYVCFGIWHKIICHEARERIVQEKIEVLVYVYASRNNG
jgi:hypothetical protein